METTKNISLRIDGNTALKNYMWNNLITDKKNSDGLLYKLYSGSILHDFITIFSYRLYS